MDLLWYVNANIQWQEPFMGVVCLVIFAVALVRHWPWFTFDTRQQRENVFLVVSVCACLVLVGYVFCQWTEMVHEIRMSALK